MSWWMAPVWVGLLVIVGLVVWWRMTRKHTRDPKEHRPLFHDPPRR